MGVLLDGCLAYSNNSVETCPTATSDSCRDLLPQDAHLILADKDGANQI